MAISVPNQAEVNALQLFINQDDLDLRLFKNNHVPANTDTEADYVEADFVGYATELLVNATWAFTPGDPSTANYGDVVFTSTGGGQSQFVYGYYVTRRADGFLLWSERFDDNDPTAPYEIVNVGDDITVPLAFEAKDTGD